MKPQKIQKQVRDLIFLVEYYEDMWSRQSNVLHPLTEVTSNKVKFRWKYAEQKFFYDTKSKVGCCNLL